ncbi:hypothetical protein LEMLEM_LOCUS4287 [Lemmus lemmus]
MRRCSGKAKDRDWGSAGRRVGSCSPGPVSCEGPHRVPACRKCGELSAQHRHQPHRPLRAAPEPCGPRQRVHPPVSPPLPLGRPGSRPPKRPQRCRGLGNELTELGSRQEEPQTPALVFPEAAKLWARPTGSQPSLASLQGLGRPSSLTLQTGPFRSNRHCAEPMTC